MGRWWCWRWCRRWWWVAHLTLAFWSFLLGLVEKKMFYNIAHPFPCDLRSMKSEWIKYERICGACTTCTWPERNYLSQRNRTLKAREYFTNCLKFVLFEQSDTLNQAPINSLSLYLLWSNNLFIITATIAASHHQNCKINYVSIWEAKSILGKSPFKIYK